MLEVEKESAKSSYPALQGDWLGASRLHVLLDRDGIEIVPREPSNPGFEPANFVSQEKIKTCL